jgi:hypothetical protein
MTNIELPHLSSFPLTYGGFESWKKRFDRFAYKIKLHDDSAELRTWLVGRDHGIESLSYVYVYLNNPDDALLLKLTFGGDA